MRNRATCAAVRVTWLVLTGLLLPAVFGASAAPAGAAEAAGPPTRPVLRVGTRLVAPFVFKQGEELTGFSVDLWDTLAQRLDVDFSWVEYPSTDDELQAVQSGDVDVAISKITMTPERDRMVDFSHPIFDSGLQILVRAHNDTSWSSMMRMIVSRAIWQFLAAASVIVFVLANVLWLVHRRSDARYQRGYIPGVLEGLWGVVLIIATGEYGDRDTPDVVARLTVATMWLLGVVLVAQFTATVTSRLTVHQLRSTIQGPGDLPGKTLATVPGGVAAEYLTQLGIPFVEVRSGDQACEMLLQGQVQAVVFDAPVLQYWAAKRGRGVLRIVGPLLRLEKYGIAVAPGSPLRKQINEALLELYGDGTYEAIYSRWFSHGP